MLSTAMSPHIFLVLLALVASQALGAPPGEQAESYEDRLSKLEKLYEVQTEILQKQHIVIEDQQQHIDKQNQVNEAQQQQIDQQHQVNEAQQQQIDKQNQHILDLQQQVMILNRDLMDQKQETQDHRLVTHHLKKEIDSQKQNIGILRQQIENEKQSTENQRQGSENQRQEMENQRPHRRRAEGEEKEEAKRFIEDKVDDYVSRYIERNRQEENQPRQIRLQRGLGDIDVHSMGVGAVAFSVYRTTEYTASPSGSNIPFDNVDINIGGGFVVDAFTAPTSGIYVFHLQVAVSPGLQAYVYLRHNDAVTMTIIGCNSEGNSAYYLTCSQSIILNLVQGDRVTARLEDDDEIVSNTNRFTTFSGFLLHAII